MTIDYLSLQLSESKWHEPLSHVLGLDRHYGEIEYRHKREFDDLTPIC